jgi:hypothetical protein
MAAAQIDLAGVVSRYAETFHDVIGPGHQVASPLGGWLLLALSAQAADRAHREQLADVLGCDAGQAESVAAQLLATPHPLVAAAAAVWSRPGLADEQWLAGLPAEVERGDVPSQHELDEWARRHTFGLIETFPVQVDDLVYLLLATALATKVSWDCPFDTAPGSALGEASPWAQRLARVLRSPRHPSHSAFIATTPQAGDVTVHVGRARGGLQVASVAAAPDVAAAAVLAAAHGLATAYALGQSVPRRSLFDLPLGETAMWSVKEELPDHGGGERCTAILPAWSARSEHDLTDPRLGFAAVAAALGKGDPWEAKQAAMAQYSRIGFEAAAVSAVAIMSSRLLPAPGPMRTAELRFGHPYAVVAVTVADQPGHSGPWHGIPAFSGWIAEPRDADERA